MPEFPTLIGREEAALRALMERMSPLAALIRGDELVDLNPAGCALLGRTREQVLGRDFWELALAQDQERIRERERQAGNELPRRFTQRLHHAHGHELWIDYSVDRIELDGRPALFVTGHDVTAHHGAHAALAFSEDRFRSAFQNAAIGKALVSADLRFRQVNRAYCAMFGYDESELLSMSPEDLTHPEDTGSNDRLIRELKSGARSSGRVVKRYRRKDGATVWGDLTLTLLRDAAGEPHFFIGEVVDITERRLAEELLRDREAKLAEAQRVAHLGSWEYDIATGRSIWSDEMYRIFGFEPGTFDPTRDSALPRIHPDDVGRSGAFVEETIRNGTPYEYEFRILRHGALRHLWTIGRAELGPDGKPSRVYGIVQDVTERKLAEEALRASERRFRNLYTTAPVMMSVVGPDRRIKEVSNHWLGRMGYERDEVVGREGHHFLTPDSFLRLIQEHDRTIAAGEHIVRSIPLVAIRKDGSTVNVITTSVLEFDEQQVFQGAVTVGMDVTHIQRAEEAVRESEERYRALVEHAPEAIVVADGDNGKFIDVNEQALRLFRRTREQLLALGPADCSPVHQANGRASAEMAQDMIQRANVELQTFEWIHLDGEGREIPCLVRLSRMPDRTRNLVRATITDISEQKAIEEKLRRDDKLAAVGVLAAGVAHEIGNPLLAMSMAVQSLERKATEEYALAKLGLVRGQIERISKIVRQMGDLARPRAASRERCDLNRLVERSLEVIRFDKRAKEVEIDFAPCADAPSVLAVEDQLMQVCLNLGLNALDAVAGNPPARPRALRIRSVLVAHAARTRLRVVFADTGPGVPEHARALVFQPFYTTKAAGQGTGLGLSVSRRIVEDHAGDLGFECPPTGGTEFYFEIPVEVAL
jgi:PAS domain S-box-containing protein